MAHKGESKEMEEGREARRKLKPLTANPYSGPTTGKGFKYKEWEAGWDFEDYERQGMNEEIKDG